MTENRHTHRRRSFCALAGGAAVSLALSTGCSRRDWAYASTAGRLTARPHASQKSYISGRNTLGLALPKKSSAMPPDVRKAFVLPASPPFGFLGYAQFVGAEPRIHYEPERKRRALPHIRRHSRVS